jgi:hypothetical protein
MAQSDQHQSFSVSEGWVKIVNYTTKPMMILLQPSELGCTLEVAEFCHVHLCEDEALPEMCAGLYIASGAAYSDNDCVIELSANILFKNGVEFINTSDW